jgi:uncharacterized membrane protein
VSRARVIGRDDPRRRRERGAIGILTPVVLLAIAIPVMMLGIDVGRLAWNRRELQEIADLAALDAMRAFGQCRETSEDPVAAAQASALRNGYDGNLADAPNKVEIGTVTTDANHLRHFTAGGTAATATAIRVFATRQVPFTIIASAFLPGSATLQVEAVASRVAEAGISAGSFAARFDTSDSWAWNATLGPLLGEPLSLSAISYQGLADANFTLGDLKAAANVGSLEELLDLELSAPEYLNLLADAVSDGGSASVVSTLNSLAGSADATLSVTLGDIIQVASGAHDAALDAQLNALDMLAVGAQVARGDAAVLISPLGLTIPGLASATAQLRIVQAPHVAIGAPGQDASGKWNTEVHTGQVRLAINLSLGNKSILGISVPVGIDLFVEAAQTDAHLDAIDCADADDPIHRAVVGVEPGIVRLGIGKFPDFMNSADPVPSKLTDVKVTLPPIIPFGPPVTVQVAEVTGFSDIDFQSSGIDLRFDGPFVDQIPVPSEENTQTVGTPLADAISNALAALLASSELQVTAVNGAVPLTTSQKNTVLTTVTNALQPVLSGPPALTGLDDYLTSLFDALGISLGGADITVTWLNAGQKRADGEVYGPVLVK